MSMTDKVNVANSHFKLTVRLLLVTLPIIFTVSFLYPIVLSGLSGDDIPNSMRSAVLRINDWSRWEYIKLAVSQWKTNEGRFFPVSAIENVFMFDLIHSVTLYKVVQLSITVAMLVIAAFVATKITDSPRSFVLMLFVLLSCLQTRNWFDPTLSFGLLLQSVQIKILICICSICFFLNEQRKGRLWILASGVVFWSLALLQYEVVVTLFPGLVFLIFLRLGSQHDKRIATFALGIPTAIYLTYIFRLRSGVTASSTYTVHTDLAITSITYIKQLSGALPFSAIIWSRGARALQTSVSLLPLLLLFLLAATVVLVVSLRSSLAVVSTRNSFALFIIGLNFLLGPGITTALSLRWQSEVAWGLSYLSVSFAYTGFAFVSVSTLCLVAKLVKPQSLTYKLGLSFFCLFFSSAAISNHVLLRDNVSASQGSKKQRDSYELAVKSGFLAQIPDSSIVVHSSYSENSWVNSYFTEWLNGPKGLVFVSSQEEASSICKPELPFKRCPIIFHLEYLSPHHLVPALSLKVLDSNQNVFAPSFYGGELLNKDLQELCAPFGSYFKVRKNTYSCSEHSQHMHSTR
jgi:hypothetical protein